MNATKQVVRNSNHNPRRGQSQTLRKRALVERPPGSKRIGVLMTNQQIAQMDQAAKLLGMTRQEFFQHATEDKLARGRAESGAAPANGLEVLFGVEQSEAIRRCCEGKSSPEDFVRMAMWVTLEMEKHTLEAMQAAKAKGQQITWGLRLEGLAVLFRASNAQIAKMLEAQFVEMRKLAQQMRTAELLTVVPALPAPAAGKAVGL